MLNINNNKWINCNLTNTRMVASTIRDTILDGSDLSNVDMRWSDLIDVSLKMCIKNTITLNFQKFKLIKFQKVLIFEGQDTYSSPSETREGLLDIMNKLSIDNIERVHELTEAFKRQVQDVQDLKEKLSRTAEDLSRTKELIEIRTDIILANNIPFKKNLKFIGRDEVLEEVKRKLESSQTLVLTGLPGVGKTSVALEYAYNINNQGFVVNWIESETITSFNLGYKNFAFRLKVPDFDGSALSILRVLDNLKALNSMVLLVLNNLEDYKSIQDYMLNLPQNVKVLITSCDDTIPLERIKIEPFNKDQTTKYIINNIIGNIDESEMNCLYTKISDNDSTVPYELEQNVSWLNDNIERQKGTIAEISNRLDSDMSHMFKKLDKNQGEWLLLQYMSHLNVNIDIELLTGLMKQTYQVVKSGLDHLAKLSLVQIVTKNNKISNIHIHGLTQKHFLKYCDKTIGEDNVEASIIENLLHYISMNFNQVEKNPDEKWENAKIYYSHALKLLENPTNTTESILYKVDILQKLGEYSLYVTFNKTKSLEYHTQAIELLSSIPNPSTELNFLIAKANDFISNLYIEDDEYKSAEIFSTKSQRILMNLLSLDHDNIKMKELLVESLCGHGIACTRQADLDRAELYLQKALDICELNREVINTKFEAVLYNELGVVYWKKGGEQNISKASGFFNKSLEIREKLGSMHDIAESANNVGQMFRVLKNNQEANLYFTKSYETLKAIHPYGHPDIARVLINIGLVCRADKKLDEAIVNYSKALEIFKEYNMLKSSDAALLHNNMGFVYFDQEKYDEALSEHQEAFVISDEVHQGADHPDSANCLSRIGFTLQTIAGILQENGDFSGAKIKYQEAAIYHKNAVEMLHDEHQYKKIFQTRLESCELQKEKLEESMNVVVLSSDISCSNVDDLPNIEIYNQELRNEGLETLGASDDVISS